MYLKKIEIFGFKSFADKVDIEIIPGITAIVGPNGSGKSNIADAIRWALGEQSPKVLRGSKMEDVIFSGTDSRKPVGMAEVSLVLDNADRAIDIDYSEVKITRRMFKSGESEYYINKTPCRLKDIQQLFMDTGIGKEGYSIIGQGRIDQLLSDKPQDRRGIFEEAVGIVKYKLRKTDAEKKLEQTMQNIQRTEDILSELELQLGPLEEASQKARRYMGLINELKNIDINLFLHNYDKLKKRIASIKDEYALINDSLAKQELIKQEKSKELAEKKDMVQGNAESISNLHIAILNNKDKLEAINSLINRNEQKATYAVDEIKRLMQEINESESQISHREDTASNLKSQIKQQEDILKGLLAELAEHDKRLSEINEQIEKHNVNIKNKKEQLIDMMSRKADMNAKLNMLISELRIVEQRIDKLNDEVETLYADENHFVSAKLRAQQTLSDIKQKLEQRELELKAKSQEIESITAKIDAITKQRIDIDRNIHSQTSQLKLLEDMENNMEGFNRSVKLIMDERSADPLMAKGIYGPVGRLIQVDAEYEAAMEAALGASIQYIVVENEDNARYAIEFLKAKQGGRATFLPITAVKPKYMTQREKSVLQQQGCLGVACDMLKFDTKFENIIKHLLGRVVICDNLTNAVNIAKAFKYSFQIVTLEGDTIGSGGYISGGSPKRRGNDILSRAGHIKRLDADIERNKHEYTILSKKLEELNLERGKYQRQYAELESDISKMRIEHARNEEIYKNVEHECAEALNKRETKEAELLASIEDKTVYEKKIIQCQNELENLEQQRLLFDQGAEENDKLLQELAVKKENIIKKMTSLQVDVAKVQSECDSLKSRLQDIDAEAVTKRNDINCKREQIKAKEEENALLKNQIEAHRCELEKLHKENDKLMTDIKNLEDAQKNLQADVAYLEQEINQLGELVSDLKNRLYKADIQKQHLEEQLQALQDNMWETYQLSYTEALKYKADEFELAEAAAKKEKLKEEIAALGTVNPSSIEEYERVHERFDFLKKQHDDLIEAMKTLENLIVNLENNMRRQFVEQFSIINANFQRTFKRLFGGGNASLILEEGDVLEAGITVVAQPPGKKLQSIMLLSGGERTLTAIAILFALLEIRPSPFCVLDEIEAALDEVNAQRFAKFIKDYSRGSQFIIITHRRSTMEAANALYGVSMVERGVSKLISVQLEEKSEVVL